MDQSRRIVRAISATVRIRSVHFIPFGISGENALGIKSFLE